MAAPPRRLSALLQVGTQIQMVIDLAVEDDDVATAIRHHGLMPSARQIDNGQAAETEAHLSIDIGPHATIVGATVPNLIGHGFQYKRLLRRVLGSTAQKAGQSAHACRPPAFSNRPASRGATCCTQYSSSTRRRPARPMASRRTASPNSWPSLASQSPPSSARNPLTPS